MAISDRETIRTYPQAMAVANWTSVATLTASAYTQIIAANGERSQGVWVYNNNAVSFTSSAYLYKSATPPSDSLDVILIQPVFMSAGLNALGRNTVFIPGTGAVFARSVNDGVKASLAMLEW